MRNFFKFFFASCLGTIIGLGLLIGIIILIFSVVASQSSRPESIRPNSVLHLKMENPIPELTNNVESNPFNLQNQNILGLQDIVDAIEHARDDEDIKGIFLDFESLDAGPATAYVLRNALQEFRESGKFIVSYGNMYSQGAYYLASTSDKIFINPVGNIDFRGYSTMIPFFKNMLDKIGVDMQIFYAGDFKSATEPLRRTDMSKENRLQQREFLQALFQHYLEALSESRGKSIAELKEIADQYKIRRGEDALTYGLADEVGYRDQVMADIRERLGIDEDQKIPFATLASYSPRVESSADYSVRDRIAVVYAEGSITRARESELATITGPEYTKIISQIRDNDRIKAVVLRVNSPGGDGQISKNIWRELSLLKETGKPLVVSMGDYAASGGYYIACLADTILAEPTTITGSIGVFSVIPNINELMTDKLGITFDTVKTGAFANGINTIYPLSPGEQELIRNLTQDFYQDFLQVVANGRGMSREEVHNIGQGRIWTGERAVELGLVDRLGGLDDAVAIAANLAGLPKYRLTEYPRIKTPLEEFIEEFIDQNGQAQLKSALLKEELNEYLPIYDYVQELQQAKGPQARLPLILNFR